MPKAAASDWFASTSTFARSTWPPRLDDRGLERGAELAARPAPLGPEVDDHRHLARALDHRVAKSDSLTSKTIVPRLASGAAISRRNLMEDSLRGKLLIASPALVDPNFARDRRPDHRAQRRGRDGGRPQPAVRDARSRTWPGAVGDRRRRAGVRRRAGAAPGAGRAGRVQRPGGGRLDRGRRRRLRLRRHPSTTTSRGRSGGGGFTPAIRAGAPDSSKASSPRTPGSWSRRMPAELFPDDPLTLWQRRAGPQGRAVRADRADARRSVAELIHRGREAV